MNFLIYGSGAIGSYIGGTLALAGQTVTFLDRPAPAEILRARGITLHQDGGSRTARDLHLVTSAAEALAQRDLDCMIVAVKSFDTDGVISDIRAAGLTPPPIFCLQNGVDNEPKLREAFGADRVIAGTVLTAIGIRGPGDIVIERNRGLGLWGGHPLSERLASVFRSAGVMMQLYSNADAMKWSKLITNLMANATAAICDIGAEAVYAHPGLYDIEVRMMREALKVMDAKRLPVVALPRTPTRELNFALRWLPSRLYQPIIQRMVARGRGDKKPSFHQDLSAGKPRTEVNYLNGAVARHAEALGLHAPVNRALTEILEGVVAGKIAWDEYRGKPDRLVEEVLG
ncbi:MAG TPA: ketopantoate reductase family protein [Anaerolineales bacterium]|nr:ketopantoate reductase family protein [Anaerolineales bacterium]